MALAIIDFNPGNDGGPSNSSSAWLNWPTAPSMDTITTLSGEVLVDATWSATAEKTGEGIALRIGISFDGGSTYDYSMTTTTDIVKWHMQYSAGAFERRRVSLRHVAKGTLTGDLIINCQYISTANSTTDWNLHEVRGFALELT